MKPFASILTGALLVALVRAELPAQPADRFADSIGVCTHWTYPDTPYGHAYEAVKARLIESGIRHIRDGLSDRLIDLGRAGILATVAVQPDRPIEAWLAAIRDANAAGARIVAIEGPNEPDVFWLSNRLTYPPGETSPTNDAEVIRRVLRFQRDLYTAVKADPDTRYLTVIGPALGRTYGYEQRSPFGAGTLADWVDWGNVHLYHGGNSFSTPFPYAGLERYLWQGGQASANLDEFPFAFDIYAPPFVPKPMACTEAGYSTFNDGTTEATHAKYVPRLFCEHFRAGMPRTFLYEFVDEWNLPEEREANFGLLRHDLSPKPAFECLRRLIELTAEPAARPFVPKPLPARLAVYPAPGFDRVRYVRHIALQKSDGTYILLLWHDIALDDTHRKPWRRLPLAPPMPAVLTFSQPATQVEVFVPNDGEAPIARFADTNTIRLGVPDRVMAVRITFD